MVGASYWIVAGQGGGGGGGGRGGGGGGGGCIVTGVEVASAGIGCAYCT